MALCFSAAACGQQKGAAVPQRDVKNGKRIVIEAEGKRLTAVLETGAAAEAFLKKLPLTVPMENLYEREMCFHLGPGSLPSETPRSDGYEVGDLIYWPPRGSLVILYKQNGERFERQQLGRIEGNVGFFEGAGTVRVTFKAE